MRGKTWLVVGLGNPGAQYAANRHNVGQMVGAELARRINSSLTRHKTLTLVAEGFVRPGGVKLVLARSTGFMNLSGAPVLALLKFYSLSLDRLIVVHDELDLPFNTVRLKFGGGHGGHNGLRDISNAVGSDYIRVRVGIGRPPGAMDVADFVLHDFTLAERVVLSNIVQNAADAVELVVEQGLTVAQSRVHTPSAPRVE